MSGFLTESADFAGGTLIWRLNSQSFDKTRCVDSSDIG